MWTRLSNSRFKNNLYACHGLEFGRTQVKGLLNILGLLWDALIWQQSLWSMGLSQALSGDTGSHCKRLKSAHWWIKQNQLRQFLLRVVQVYTPGLLRKHRKGFYFLFKRFKWRGILKHKKSLSNLAVDPCLLKPRFLQSPLRTGGFHAYVTANTYHSSHSNSKTSTFDILSGPLSLSSDAHSQCDTTI